MKPEDQRIEIAVATGAMHHRWKKPEDADPQCEDCCQFQSEDPSNFCVIADLPDYLNDLNAMHAAEMVLTDDQYTKYEEAMWEVMMQWVDVPTAGGTSVKLPCRIRGSSAPANQRAEALLKTIGRWTEKKVDDLKRG